MLHLWLSFSRQKDLENFLDHTRQKFVGFEVKNDHSSLAGLPQPIHEGVKVLKQVWHLFIFPVQIWYQSYTFNNDLSSFKLKLDDES